MVLLMRTTTDKAKRVGETHRQIIATQHTQIKDVNYLLETVWNWKYTRYLSTTIQKKEHKRFGCSSLEGINDKKGKQHIPWHCIIGNWTCKIMKVQNKNKRNDKIKFVTTIKSDHHHHFHFFAYCLSTHPPRTLIATYEWERERDRVNILQNVVEGSSSLFSYHEFEFM